MIANQEYARVKAQLIKAERDKNAALDAVRSISEELERVIEDRDRWRIAYLRATAGL